MQNTLQILAIGALAVVPSAVIASGMTTSSWLTAASCLAIVMSMLYQAPRLRRAGRPDAATMVMQCALAAVGVMTILAFHLVFGAPQGC